MFIILSPLCPDDGVLKIISWKSCSFTDYMEFPLRTTMKHYTVSAGQIKSRKKNRTESDVRLHAPAWVEITFDVHMHFFGL